MIYELTVDTVKSMRAPEYLELIAGTLTETWTDGHGQLVGSWVSDIGQLNEVIHLWCFRDLNERERFYADLSQRRAGIEDKARALEKRRTSTILRALMDVTPPPSSGYVYELRHYWLMSGTTPQWAKLFLDAMPARKQYSTVVGLWAAEGDRGNEVYHLWAYKDLKERAEVRAVALRNTAWQAFVIADTPLLDEMENTILLPTRYSPLA